MTAVVPAPAAASRHASKKDLAKISDSSVPTRDPKRFNHVKRVPFDVNSVPEDRFFTSKLDNHKIFFNIWKPQSPPIAVVLAFHGIGEHTLRYDHVFSHFATQGVLVKGMDYRGHGRTVFKNKKKAIQGFTPSFDHIFSDMNQLYALPVEPFGDLTDVPTFVYGHSMGGELALLFCDAEVGKRIPRFSGLVLQAPYLGSVPPLPALNVWVVKNLGGGFMGKIQIPSDLPINGLCSSDEVITKYLEDGLNHGYLSLRWAHEATFGREYFLSHLPEFKHPFSLHFSENDKLTSFEYGKKFFEGCASVDKELVTYPSPCEHELHNEPSVKERVIASHVAWITKRAKEANLCSSSPAGGAAGSG